MNMTCKHVYELRENNAYVWTAVEPNDMVNVTIKCVYCGHEKTATIGVEDRGVWE